MSTMMGALISLNLVVNYFYQDQKHYEFTSFVKPSHGVIGPCAFLEDGPDRNAWIVVHIFHNVVRAPNTVKYSPEMK